MAFSQQQRTQISNACEQVQNAININNSTLAVLNENLVRKADEIAIKWKAYGLPYNAIRDAVLEMAMWQKEQIMEQAIDAVIVNDETSGCIVDCEQGCLVLEPHTYPIGQKLKILIIKYDEQ